MSMNVIRWTFLGNYHIAIIEYGNHSARILKWTIYGNGGNGIFRGPCEPWFWNTIVVMKKMLGGIN